MRHGARVREGGAVVRRGRRTLAATGTALLLVLALSALSRLPYPVADEDVAVLRLSWRAAARVEEACRTLSAEELERLPVHMRNPEACRRRGVPYRLEVEVDGAPTLGERMQPAGPQGDRPIYVFHDLPVEPGDHHVRVTFVPQEDEDDQDDERDGLPFDGRLRFAPTDVALITYDATAGKLVLRGARHP